MKFSGKGGNGWGKCSPDTRAWIERTQQHPKAEEYVRQAQALKLN